MVQSHLEPYKADRLLVKATALPGVGNIMGIIRDKQTFSDEAAEQNGLKDGCVV